MQIECARLGLMRLYHVSAGEGKLTYLQWSDFSCNSCGGQLSSTCLVTQQSQPQRSCAGIASLSVKQIGAEICFAGIYVICYHLGDCSSAL